jgi:N-acetyl-anhydromuramyl-L-alanine amidase AmpD
VLHHSATQNGSAASFDKAHRKRGWRRGLGYHFVIGNGNGSGDGEIEVGPRWKHQQSGAHAGAGAHFYNNYGIGICLVGNFELTSPTPRQLIALQALVRALMGRYHIAPEKIFSHRQIRPKPTRCPGDRFPLKRLLRAVSAPSS